MASDTNPITGSATTTINKPIGEVFAAVADITKMGDRSPECTAARWVDGADGPATGAKFEGDNLAKIGPITMKRWTTTSEITEYSPDEVFEFLSAEKTTWRYELSEAEGKTVVTESFSYPPYEGFQKVLTQLLNRPKGMVKGMQATLESIKAAVEG